MLFRSLSYTGGTLTYSASVTTQSFGANQIWYVPKTTFALQIGASGFNAALKIDATNNYVGIDSVSTPSCPLHIGSGAYAGTVLSGGVQLRTSQPIYVATDGTRTAMIGTDGTSQAFAGTLTAHDFQLRAGNGIAATVQQGTLNVGIGTANPGAQLQVERAGGTSSYAEYLRLRNTTFANNSNTTIGFYVANNSVEIGRAHV